MSQPYRTPAFEIQLSENSASEKIQLFRTGTFHHPEHGQFEITPQLLTEIKKNYEAKVRGIDIALDYKHDNDAEAAAWFKELILSDDGHALYAKVEWTPKGKKVVEDKEFRYISPEFTFNYTDNETLKEHGPTLLGAGLTNRPVIKKMKPVVNLAEYPMDELQHCVMEMMPELAKQHPQDQAVAIAYSKCRKKLGIEASEKNKNKGENTMTLEELTKKVEALEKQNNQLSEENKNLKLDKQKLEDSQKMAEKKTAFQKLMSEGKAVAAQEEAFLAGDMVKFTELAQPLNLAEKGKGDGGQGKGNGGDGKITKANVDAKIHELAEKKMKDKTAKSLGEAYHQVLLENKELSDIKYAN